LTSASVCINNRKIRGRIITVHVKYFANIREVAGISNDSLDLVSGSTVYDLLYMITELYGDEMGEEIFDNKNASGLRDDMMLTINEAIINHMKSAETMLKPGDVVALFPIFPGGG